MHPTPAWYAGGMRRIGDVLAWFADSFERPYETMPRHVSSEEVLGELRNRANAGFEPVGRSLY